MNTIARVLLAISLLAFAAPARAQADDPAALERAKAAFGEGIRLYDAKRYPEALEQFRAAYKDRPSPGIKRNMALCLRAMGKNAEAVTLLEEMLVEGREGREQLKPDVKAAAEQAIAEMLPTVGSARLLLVVRASPNGPPPAVMVTVDGEPRTRKDDILRLAPGEHAVTARAEGYYQASQKISVKAGERDVPVRLEIAATDAWGHATIRASRPDAQISIDGVVVATQGTWAGFVAVGRHHLQVDAPGAPPNVRWLDIYQNRTERLGVEMDPPRDRPPEYDTWKPPPPAAPAQGPQRDWYVMASPTFQAQRLTPTAVLGGNGSSKDTYTGFAVALRAGRRISKGWSLEGHVEIGGLSSPKTANTVGGIPAEGGLVQWVLAPGVRFRTSGSARFYLVGHLGLEVSHLSGSYGVQTAPSGPVTTVRRSDSSASPVAMFELGMQIELGKGGAILELGVFGEGHDVKGLKESGTKQSFFIESIAARYGARAAFGWEF